MTLTGKLSLEKLAEAEVLELTVGELLGAKRKSRPCPGRIKGDALADKVGRGSTSSDILLVVAVIVSIVLCIDVELVGDVAVTDFVMLVVSL